MRVVTRGRAMHDLDTVLELLDDLWGRIEVRGKQRSFFTKSVGRAVERIPVSPRLVAELVQAGFVEHSVSERYHYNREIYVLSEQGRRRRHGLPPALALVGRP